ILGETGTGKELLARAVHNLSDRRDRPLVKVNCAALPANLIESELFGHEKGAFTGAVARKIGRFELADGGTIFLDEIGDLSLELQSKLLRVLQEGEFERVGNPQTTKVDVRIISATNRDLEKAIEDGSFREDLYYRLNVFPIQSPPLRERKEDIPILVRHFIKKFTAKTGKKIETVPQKVMDALQGYHWPGNVREVENIIERAVIISPGKQLKLEDWLSKTVISSKASHISTLEEFEREHILEVLELARWRVSGESGAAKVLGLKPTTLEARMKKLGITRKT
ncbi:sigma 54-interacting transcriptional regulator, partial [candidate division KSB1 bacterium]|nr:sigma 54-interacting transcriptional regulator [candidate division KSB1 bacterium]